MSIALLLIPLALLLLVVAVGAFFWAVDSGQFDDLKAAGSMALEEDAADRYTTGPAVAKPPA